MPRRNDQSLPRGGGHKTKKNGSSPLDFIDKAIRTGRFPIEPSSHSQGKKLDDYCTTNDTTKGYHQLDRKVLKESCNQAKIYRPLWTDGGAPQMAAGSNNCVVRGEPRSSSPEISFLPVNTLEAVVMLARQQQQQQQWKNESQRTAGGAGAPAVLVFASDSNPGGSKTATNVGTQEEAICRASTLSVAQRMLDYPIPEMGVAYVPYCQTILAAADKGVVVFHAICAALRLAIAHQGSPSFKEVQFIHQKVATVLACARQHGHRTLILGSWGLGAFGNDAHIVAAAFRTMLLEKPDFASAFSHVIFAIPNQKFRTVFENVFAGACLNDPL